MLCGDYRIYPCIVPISFLSKRCSHTTVLIRIQFESWLNWTVIYIYIYVCVCVCVCVCYSIFFTYFYNTGGMKKEQMMQFINKKYLQKIISEKKFNKKKKRRSLTGSRKRTSIGPSRSCWSGTIRALQPEEITSKGSRVSCVYYQ